MAGKFPAAPRPSAKRATPKPKAERASAWHIAATDQKVMAKENPLRVPKRSIPVRLLIAIGSITPADSAVACS